MNYYICVRNAIQKFEELACKVAIEGGTLNLTLLSLSGVLFGYSLPLAALLISFGSIFTSISLGFLAWFYSKLLAVSVETAKNLEDDIFPPTWNSNLKEKKMGKMLAHNLDDFVTIFGKRLAGKYTWKVFRLEFGILVSMGLFLFFFYLWPFLFPPIDC
jgi:hypothetical protein